jgi:hypothetical protein
MNRLLVVAAGLTLGACGTTSAPAPESKVIAVEVDKAVTASCVPAILGEPPAYATMKGAIVAAPDMAARYQLLASDFVILLDRITETEPVITGCHKP